MSTPHTDDRRLRTAIRTANWAALKEDLTRARIYILVAIALVAVVVFFSSEPRQNAGYVSGSVVALNVADSKRPRPAQTITVRLDDGRTAVVITRGRILAAEGARVTLRETRHLGWWRRSTFTLERAP